MIRHYIVGGESKPSEVSREWHRWTSRNVQQPVAKTLSTETLEVQYLITQIYVRMQNNVHI